MRLKRERPVRTYAPQGGTATGTVYRWRADFCWKLISGEESCSERRDCKGTRRPDANNRIDRGIAMKVVHAVVATGLILMVGAAAAHAKSIRDASIV